MERSYENYHNIHHYDIQYFYIDHSPPLPPPPSSSPPPPSSPLHPS